MRGKNLVNVLLFQSAWFAAVMGAARGFPWLGPAAVAAVLVVHVVLVDDRRGEWRKILAAGFLGFWLDTIFVAAGIFTPKATVYPLPFSPPWMVFLWVNFSLTLNASLSWLQGRYRLAAVFGAVGGPLAYYAGAEMGATETLPSVSGMLVLMAAWALTTPVLVRLAGYLKRGEARTGKVP
jgi:hypothetical protein